MDEAVSDLVPLSPLAMKMPLRWIPDLVDWIVLLGAFVTAVLSGLVMGRGPWGFLFVFTTIVGVYAAVRYWRGGI